MQKLGGALIPMNVDRNSAVFSSVNYLVGSLDRIVNVPLVPYSEEACCFLEALSQKLLRDKRIRQYPDVASFAYWCRKSSINQHKKEARENSSFFDSRLGRGLSFHIAPSNIPVNFAFSFAFSLLAGNSSIVRVPSKPFEQVIIICDAIQALLDDHPEIASRCVFVSYPIDNEITTSFSLLADIRMIWGGDSTIANLQTIPKKPRCIDVMFADRYSIALINGEYIRKMSEKELENLAERFYNDTYLMDQNACSSPQMIFWKNADDVDKNRFWSAIKEYAALHYEVQAQIAIDKYVQLCSDIIDETTQGKQHFDSLLTVVTSYDDDKGIECLRGKGGYFYQRDIASLDDLAPCVSDRFQTLVYEGFDAKELGEFIVARSLRGIDRVVPIGSAMDIDIVWDGYDLVSELSRIVDAR